MNRIILIGNGFDLAHGLKTSYVDFIQWYIRQALERAGGAWEYQDELMSIVLYDPANFNNIYNRKKYFDDLLDYLYKHGFKALINNEVMLENGQEILFPFKTLIKSHLLSKLLEECSSERWVDIENEFYVLLKDILKIELKPERERLLKEINDSLRIVISFLEQYLEQLPKSEMVESYQQLITAVIKRGDIIVEHHLKEDQYPEKILLLNFNYTNTTDYYQNPAPNIIHPNSVIINHIHGKIRNTKHPMIFGFGDELDDDYRKIERDKAKGFFNYIKSFWYFKNSNYHDLVRFAEGDEFQVYILGHSCGLSDRTMLNMIFEHQNCKSIKVFYHQALGGKNNFTDLTEEIARHFKDKSMMRKKIVPYDLSSPMPQQ